MRTLIICDCGERLYEAIIVEEDLLLICNDCGTVMSFKLESTTYSIESRAHEKEEK